MKYFLLIAGDNYYPDIGTNDWLGTFETEELAMAQVSMGDTNYSQPYTINSRQYDWIKIVNLKKWIEKE